METTVQKLKSFFGFIEDETQTDNMLNTAEKSNLKPFKGSLIDNQQSRPFASSEIKVEEPRIYEDSLNIATQLRSNKPVIVNLKYLDPDVGKRLIDFICGTAYAINGHMMKIGENIFVFTPSNVLITDSSDKTQLPAVEETEEQDIFFKKVKVS